MERSITASQPTVQARKSSPQSATSGLRGVLWVVVSAALAGCSGDSSCQRYVGAVSACVQARGLSVDTYDETAICAEWDDAHEARYGVWYTCRTQAYADVQCEDDDAYVAALEADAACEAP